MNNYLELPVQEISKKKIIEYTKSCKIKRIGYNALIFSDCMNTNALLKVTISGKKDFLTEIYNMHVLGPHNISPKLINYYWCKEPILLSDIITDEDINNVNIVERRIIKKDRKKYMGIILMEKIENILPEIPKSVELKVIKESIKSYKLGFISPEPDVIAFKKSNGSIDTRILDWGNFGDFENAKNNYNIDNLKEVINYVIKEYKFNISYDEIEDKYIKPLENNRNSNISFTKNTPIKSIKNSSIKSIKNTPIKSTKSSPTMSIRSIKSVPTMSLRSKKSSNI